MRRGQPTRTVSESTCARASADAFAIRCRNSGRLRWCDRQVVQQDAEPSNIGVSPERCRRGRPSIRKRMFSSYRLLRFHADRGDRAAGRRARAARGRPLGREGGDDPAGPAPGRDGDFVRVAFGDACGGIAGGADDVNAARTGRSRWPGGPRRTCPSGRAARAGLALRPLWPGRAGVALLSRRGLPACREHQCHRAHPSSRNPHSSVPVWPAGS